AFVQSRNVKAIVIACNTASALAASRLREECSVPVLGVIRAGARQAVTRTRNRRIGVIATEATVGSRAYELAIKSLDSGIVVLSKACPLFVPLAEEGWLEHSVTRQIAEEYLAELRASEVDSLVLGCTHYPILRRVIESVMGDGVGFVDSGEAVAEAVAQLLAEKKLLCSGNKSRTEAFVVTESAERSKRAA